MPPALIDKDRPDTARRLARAIVSDINLYNEAKIVEGIKNDDLFERLEAELKEGSDLYATRVTAEVQQSFNFYERAVVDILVRSKAAIKSPIW